MRNSKVESSGNILPLFESNRWRKTSVDKVRDVRVQGREIGFTSSKGEGFEIDIDSPIKYSGKKLSLSVGSKMGNMSISIDIIYNGSKTSYPIVGNKVEGVTIPILLDRITITILNESDNDSYIYCREIQLEVNDKSSFYKEHKMGNKLSKDKLNLIGKNLVVESGREHISQSSEFIRLIDLQPIFERYGTNRKYSLSLDIKSADVSKNSSINVYMQNGNGTRYGFVSQRINVSTEYQRFTFNGLTPTLSNVTQDGAWLALYGDYGTGNFPRAKDIQIEFGDNCTDFEEYKGTKKNIGLNKGLRFNGVDQYIYKDIISIDEFEIDFIKHSHTSGYDTLVNIGSQSVGNPFYWLYTTTTGSLSFQFVKKSDGSFESISLGRLEFGKRMKVRIRHTIDKVESHINDTLYSSMGGEFYRPEVTDRKSLSVMTYQRSTGHTTNGTLFSFKGWKNGVLVVDYDFENKPNDKRMAIDHSSNGNDGEIVGASENANIRVSNRVIRHPFKNYPFDFSRRSIEMLDNVKYASDTPRIVHDGVMIEEGTDNLFRDSLLLSESSWTKEAWNGVISDRHSLAPNGLMEATKISHQSGYLYQRKTVSAGTYHTVSAWMKSVDGSTFDCPLFIWGYNGTGGSKIRSSSTEKVTGEWKRFSVTYKALSDETSFSFGLIQTGFRKEILIWGSQHESKSYMTSYTPLARPLEKLDIPVSIDGQGGSIEFEFEGKFIEGGKQYLFDTDGLRWLIWNADSNSNYQIYTNGSARYSFPVSTMKDGKNKVKLSWSATKSETWVNDVLVGSGSHNGGSNATKIYVGRRHTDDGVHNAIFYSFTVKDRTGKTTFKF